MKRTITFSEHIFADDETAMNKKLNYFLQELSLTCTVLKTDFKSILVGYLHIPDNIHTNKYLYCVDITINADWRTDDEVPYIYISEDSKLTIQGKIESL